MSFITRVQQRLTDVDKYAQYKNLVTAYQVIDTLGIPRPKVYHMIPQPDTKDTDWTQLGLNLPNLFVVRPSIYLNYRFDYFVRNDGPKGLHVFSGPITATQDKVLATQIENINKIAESQKTDPVPALLFEEFPIVNNSLHVPVQYQAHMFYGRIGLIQVVSRNKEHQMWLDSNGEILGTSTEQFDLSSMLPVGEQLRELCSASVFVSMAAKIPYIRIDFVLSTRGPMFREFACIPADVRSNTWNWFYGRYDEKFGVMWEDAEKRLLEDLTNAEQAEQKRPEHKPTEPENDNA